MDFPLPVRTVSSVDYFTPLHVDTNIEYSLNMGKFPEINDPLHHWEPALVVASQSSATADPLETRPVPSTSSEQDQSQLDDLIDSYDIGYLQMDSMDFDFVDLPDSSLQSLLDCTESFLQLSDSLLPVTNCGDEGLYFREDSVECFHRPSGQTKRKLEDAFSSTSIEIGICKTGRLDIEELCALDYQIPLSERHGLLDFTHTSPTDTGLRQW